jgi:P27 family predicted phage terminase small subunit
MGGRKPLPTQVKQIKGTLQPCRTNYHEPIPEGLLVEPPDYMPEGAKAAWRFALECAPPILIRKLDMSVLEIWACAADLYRQAQAGIGKTGLLVKAPHSGVPMQSPYLAIANKQAQIMTKAAIEMRFTPASRSRISIPNERPGEELDLWEDIVG